MLSLPLADEHCCNRSPPRCRISRGWRRRCTAQLVRRNAPFSMPFLVFPPSKAWAFLSSRPARCLRAERRPPRGPGTRLSFCSYSCSCLGPRLQFGTHQLLLPAMMIMMMIHDDDDDLLVTRPPWNSLAGGVDLVPVDRVRSWRAGTVRRRLCLVCSHCLRG